MRKNPLDKYLGLSGMFSCYGGFDSKDLSSLKKRVQKVFDAELARLPKAVANNIRCTTLKIMIHARVSESDGAQFSYLPEGHIIQVPIDAMRLTQGEITGLIRNVLYHAMVAAHNLFILEQPPSGKAHLAYPFLKPNGEINKQRLQALRDANKWFIMQTYELEMKMRDYEDLRPILPQDLRLMEEMKESLREHYSPPIHQTQLDLDVETLRKLKKAIRLKDGSYIIRPERRKIPYALHVIAERVVGKKIELQYKYIDPEAKYSHLSAFIMEFGETLGKMSDPFYKRLSGIESAFEEASFIFQLAPPRKMAGPWCSEHAKLFQVDSFCGKEEDRRDYSNEL